MAVKNKWAILFAGIAGILSVWGYWGGGTAAGLLPEKNKNIEVSSASGEASDGFSEGRMDGGSRKVYDAALYRREGPMKDPFMWPELRRSLQRQHRQQERLMQRLWGIQHLQ